MDEAGRLNGERSVAMQRARGSAGAIGPVRAGALRGLAAIAALGAVGACLLAATPALAATTSAPAATTGVASAVTYDTASLAGNVKTGDESTEIYFQYGTTNKYGSQSPPAQIAGAPGTAPISIAISGLTAGTTYHYRFVATNSTATALGADRTFTTAKIPLSLAITAAPNPVGFGGAVTIEGTLSGTGNSGAAVQLQQAQFPYTAGFADVGNPELTLANGTFSINVLDVTLSTEYRVVAGGVASPTVLVSSQLTVTLAHHATGTRKRPTAHFSGTIAPAEPSARIAFERLVGTSWKVVGGTVASAATVSGMVKFSATVRLYHSGFFRALVLPVEGAHVSSYSQTVVVDLK
jgi:hypothetical protein